MMFPVPVSYALFKSSPHAFVFLPLIFTIDNNLFDKIGKFLQISFSFFNLEFSYFYKTQLWPGNYP